MYTQQLHYRWVSFLYWQLSFAVLCFTHDLSHMILDWYFLNISALHGSSLSIFKCHASPLPRYYLYLPRRPCAKSYYASSYAWHWRLYFSNGMDDEAPLGALGFSIIFGVHTRLLFWDAISLSLLSYGDRDHCMPRLRYASSGLATYILSFR